MSNEDRKSFTDAITCLKQTPASAEGRATGPGVLSRYDEYVATHINMTMNIHVTADFLAWHRNYIWEWENDLINTCGYTGNLPYWDWARDAYAPHESEVFNGDEFSMGSDGVFVDGRSDTYLGLMDVTFPPGTGGGCVHSGPFSGVDFSNLGPLDSPYNDNVENDYDLNPRCLVRDLNVYFSSRYLTYSVCYPMPVNKTLFQC
jgi:tyrosinase